jgi:hypothetical protein
MGSDGEPACCCRFGMLGGRLRVNGACSMTLGLSRRASYALARLFSLPDPGDGDGGRGRGGSGEVVSGPLVCITVDGVTRSCTFWLQGPRWHGWAGAASLKRGSGDRVAGAKDNPTECSRWVVRGWLRIVRCCCEGLGVVGEQGGRSSGGKWMRRNGEGHGLQGCLRVKPLPVVMVVGTMSTRGCDEPPLTCRSFLSQPELARQSVSQ